MKQETFWIRADGNAMIGAGHIMRCLSIAEELQKTREVKFLCGDQDSAALVKSFGFFSQCLQEEPFSEKEAGEILEVLGNQRASLLVDSYQLTEDYLKILSSFAEVICLDDMASYPFPYADWVVNYNLFAKEETYRKLYGGTQKMPGFLLGGKYIPLRKQFQDRNYQVREKVQDILITTGGGDAMNLGARILTTLLNRISPTVRFHMVCGAFYAGRQELEQIADTHPNVVLHVQVQQMAELMQQCDLAITAGGTTVYELCAIGVPFVAFSFVENQRQLIQYLTEVEPAMSAGHWDSDREDFLQDMVEKVEGLFSNQEKRKQVWNQEKEMVDGKGAARLAELLCSRDRSSSFSADTGTSVVAGE